MKKLLISAASLLFVVSLAACGNNKESSKPKNSEQHTKTEKQQPKKTKSDDKKVQNDDKQSTEDKEKETQKGGPISESEALALANKYSPQDDLSYGPFVKSDSGLYPDEPNAVMLTTKTKTGKSDELHDYNKQDFYANSSDINSDVNTRVLAQVSPVGEDKVHIKIMNDSSRMLSSQPNFDKVVPRY